MTATPTSPPQLPEPRLSAWTRLSDRLNPILVREVQQATRSRGFIITLGLALLSILLTALVVAADTPGGAAPGRQVFQAALMIMVPIVLAVIPIQAFTSMQQEVRGETAEQLLLSRLTPWRIVRGKLAAAMVQFALFASVFGPLLAMTFLLRGVDVPTIAFVMAIGALLCLASTAFCIALGSLSKVKLFASLAFAAAAFGLGVTTVGVMTVMDELLREVGAWMRDPDFWLAMGMFATGVLAGLLLFCMVATSMLTHPNENRSTQFRVFGLVAPLVGYAWIWGIAPVAAIRYAAPGFGIGAAAMLGAFWLFALTEDERLSPRVRTLVPRGRIAALLAWPLLPGSGRGFVYMIASGALVVAPALLIPLAVGVDPDDDAVRLMVGVLGYSFVFAGLGRMMRVWLAPGHAGSWIARTLVAFLIVMGCIVPALIEVLIEGHVGRWNLLHVTNPFWTIERMERNPMWDAYTALGIGAAVLTAAAVPAIARGCAEVAAASRERRSSAA